MAGVTILRNFWKTGRKIPIKIKLYLNKSDSKIIQMNLSGNFPSIDGSEVHFSIKSCGRPLLTTFWSWVVISRRKITYLKITQMNWSCNFLSIDGSEVHFSIIHYFWPYLTRCWSSLVTWSDQWNPFHWIRRIRINGKHNSDTTRKHHLEVF